MGKLVLYHGASSVSSAKVRLVLAEKGLAWESRAIDFQGDEHLSPAYLQINPKGQIPTLRLDGQTVTESSVIMELLEDLHPETRLRPVKPLDRAKMRLWMREVDDVLQPACGVMSFAIAYRHPQLAKTPADRGAWLARRPSPQKRAMMADLIENGLAASPVAGALDGMISVFERMDAALAENQYLAGPAYSLADAAVTPYVTRFSMLGFAGLFAARFPALTAWHERIKARPSYAEAVTGPIPEKVITLMAKTGRDQQAEIEALLSRPKAA
ncbi:MAG: glutathione S-transferase family protein [Pseudomonadota bacterium]